MTEALTRKLLACRQRLERIRRALPARAEQVLEDERLEAFRIAHNYGDVDPVRVVQEAPRGLDAVERFLVEVAGIL